MGGWSQGEDDDKVRGDISIQDDTGASSADQLATAEPGTHKGRVLFDATACPQDQGAKIPDGHSYPYQQ